MTQLITKSIILPGVVTRELAPLAGRSSALPPITIESLPRVVNIVCYRGDSLALRLEVFDADGEPADLTNLTPASQVRANPDSNNVLLEFAGFQMIGNAFETGLTAAQMATSPAGRWVWDFQVTGMAGEVQTYCGGTFTVVPDVTRI